MADVESKLTWLKEHASGLRLEVIVTPRASRTRVMGVFDGRLKIQLAAPPADGKANAALLKFVASELKIAKAQVQIISGSSSRRKTMVLQGIDKERCLLVLSPADPQQ